MEMTTDERHDSTVAEKLVDGAERGIGSVKEVLGDGAYDSARIYEFLKGKGIDAVIKPRKNSTLSTRSDARRQEVDLYRCLGHQRWAEEKGYGRRRSVQKDGVFHLQEGVRGVCYGQDDGQCIKGAGGEGCNIQHAGADVNGTGEAEMKEIASGSLSATS